MLFFFVCLCVLCVLFFFFYFFKMFLPTGTKRENSQRRIDQVEHESYVALNKRPPSPPRSIAEHEDSKELFTPWLICMKKVFKMYVLQAMAFKQTKKYAYDEIVKARQSMNKTTWLRFLTDFQLLPNLVSLSEATYVFTKNNFSLSPGKWDLREGGSTTVVSSCSTSSRWLVGQWFGQWYSH